MVGLVLVGEGLHRTLVGGLPERLGVEVYETVTGCPALDGEDLHMRLGGQPSREGEQVYEIQWGAGWEGSAVSHMG